MARIRKIHDAISKTLQSQIKITKLAEVIRELTQNGVDAGADDIKINLKVHYIENAIELEYTDNGDGINPESLEDFGRRFFTSKMDSRSEIKEALEKVNTFGFKGEAVNSLLNVCSSMIVTSRVEEYNNGFKACYCGDKRVGNIVKNNEVIPVGTSIRIIGLFDPIVVRKKMLLDTLNNSWITDIFEIKKGIFDSLIRKPKVKIEVILHEFKKSKWTSKVIVRNFGYNHKTERCEEKIPFQEQMNLFNSIFGTEICEDYELCKVQFKNYQLRAGIGLSTVQTKNYQFIYLNGRPFNNDDLNKYVNQKFQKNYERWGHNIKMNDTNGNNKQKSNTMYGRPYSVNPIFVANFEKPFEVSDLLQDTGKSCYKTRDLKILISLFGKVIDVYFGIFKKRKREVLEEPITEKKVGSKEEKKQKVKDSAILKSNVRVSKFKESELNGRLNDRKNESPPENRVYDIEKITEALTRKGREIEDYSSIDKEEHCHCHEILSQGELRNQSVFFKKIEKLNLGREDLKEFKLIGQVENKFILVRYKRQIIGLDQHATDERINLENMYKTLIRLSIFGEEMDGTLQKAIRIDFQEDETELVKNFEETFNFWGMSFKFGDGFVEVTNLPRIILNKFCKVDYSVLKKGILEFCYNLLQHKKVAFRKGQVDFRVEMESPFWWVKYIAHLPDVYRETIKSAACRGSVMFGDELSREQILLLLRGLEGCHQPFECAHGRPSLYPICSL